MPQKTGFLDPRRSNQLSYGDIPRGPTHLILWVLRGGKHQVSRPIELVKTGVSVLQLQGDIAYLAEAAATEHIGS
jgi:hypothetical protein